MPLRASKEAMLTLDFSHTAAGAHAPHGAEEETMKDVTEAAEAGPQAGDPRAAFTSADVTRRFMLGGNAIVTFESGKTGVHFTYRVQAPKKPRGGAVSHFVSVLTGPDQFQYLGCIFQSTLYSHGRNSKIGSDAKSAQAFAWAWKKLSAGIMPGGMAVFHEGRCGRCGRRLTVPESVTSGFGPECSARMEGGQ